MGFRVTSYPKPKPETLKPKWGSGLLPSTLNPLCDVALALSGGGTGRQAETRGPAAQGRRRL
jgi:hypothetical protein